MRILCMVFLGYALSFATGPEQWLDSSRHLQLLRLRLNTLLVVFEQQQPSGSAGKNIYVHCSFLSVNR